jgi:uncharacterized protein (UPF0333 family)
MAWFPYGVLLAAIALLALGVLALMLLSVWRKTKTLMTAVAAAGETVAASTAALEQAQAAAPRDVPSGHPAGSTPRHLPDGRRSPARHR